MTTLRLALAALLVVVIVVVASSSCAFCSPTEATESYVLDNGSKPNELNLRQGTGVNTHEDVSEDGFIDIEPSEFARSNGTETHDPDFEYGEDNLMVGR